jgi:hypothetical protein
VTNWITSSTNRVRDPSHVRVRLRGVVLRFWRIIKASDFAPEGLHRLVELIISPLLE